MDVYEQNLEQPDALCVYSMESLCLMNIHNSTVVIGTFLTEGWWRSSEARVLRSCWCDTSPQYYSQAICSDEKQWEKARPIAN